MLAGKRVCIIPQHNINQDPIKLFHITTIIISNTINHFCITQSSMSDTPSTSSSTLSHHSIDDDEILLATLDDIETKLFYNGEDDSSPYVTITTDDYKKMILKLLRIQQATSSLFSQNETSLKEYDAHLWRFLLTPYYLSLCFQNCHASPSEEPDAAVRAQIREKYLNQSLVHMRVFDEKMFQFKIIPKASMRIFYQESLSDDGNDDESNASSSLKQQKDPFALRNEKLMKFKIEKERKEQLKLLRRAILDLTTSSRNELTEQDREKLTPLYKRYTTLMFHQALDECKSSYPMLKQELEFVRLTKSRANDPMYQMQQERVQQMNQQSVPSKQTFQNMKKLSQSDSTEQTIQKLAGMGIQAINMEDRMNVKQEVIDRMFRPFNPPTVSLEEFAEREVQDMHERSERQRRAEEENRRKQEAKKDPDEETDEELLEKRRWDDWKDDNVKGAGNLNR